MSSLDKLQRRPRATQVVLLLASVVVLIAGLKAAQGFFVPVLLAFFIATVSFPITNWLRNHRVPRAVAVLLTVLVDFAFLAGIVLLAFTVVGDLQSKWNLEYRNLAEEKIRGVVEDVAGFEDKLKRLWEPAEESGAGVSDEDLENAPKATPVEPEPGVEPLETPVAETRSYQIGEALVGQIREMKFTQIVNVGTDVLGRVVSFFGTSLIVIILTVFMLTEARMFGRRLDAICEARGPNIQRLLGAVKDTQRYLGIKTLVSLGTGVLAGILCKVAGLDFWPLWAILAFALNYVPVVGSFIAGVPPAILALLVKGTPDAVAVAVGYFLINTFLGNFIEPMLMGRRFGLSTLVVLVSVIFWGWLWGPIGMLLAVPLTMMVKVVLDNSQEFRWIAVAIGQETHRPGEEKRIISEGAAEKDEEDDPPMSGVTGKTADAVGRS